MTASRPPLAQLSWFVVTGCSRSGTGYAARLFEELGLSCGHERIFRIDKVAHGSPLRQLDPHEAGDGRPRGDASFLAAPFVARLPPGTAVLHQVRDPVEVIRSHLGIRFFAEPFQPSWWLADEHPDFLEVIGRHTPEVLEPGDELRRTMRYWVSWNRLVESAAEHDHVTYVRYRIEDLDPELLGEILELLGQPVDADDLQRAVRRLPTDVNTRPRDESVRWGDLPAGPDLDALRRTAVRYGYEVPR